MFSEARTGGKHRSALVVPYPFIALFERLVAYDREPASSSILKIKIEMFFLLTIRVG